MSDIKQVFTLQFHSILELVEFERVTKLRGHQIDHRTLTMMAMLDDSEMELAKAGFNAEVLNGPGLR